MVHVHKGKGSGNCSYHPRSSPFSKNEQSPFTSSVQPPCTPRPFLQLTSGTSSGLLGSHARAVARRGSKPVSLVDVVCFAAGARLRENFEKAQVKHLKSSAPSSSGMFPVSARPMAIMLAAWVQISRVLGPEGSASRRLMSSSRQ